MNILNNNNKQKNECGVPVGIYTIRFIIFVIIVDVVAAANFSPLQLLPYAHVPNRYQTHTHSLSMVVTFIGYYAYFLCDTTQLLHACVFLICVQAFKHFFFAFVGSTNFASCRTPPYDTFRLTQISSHHHICT